jgi:dihydrolipoamide dehydrogenase
MNICDLLVIGSGPGGYVAAIRASQLGMKACIIEKDRPGGVCLNIGCIPSKSLIHQASLYSSLADAEQLGVSIDRSGFDYGRVHRRSRSAAEMLSRGVTLLLKKNRVELVQGEAVFKNPSTLIINGSEELSAPAIIIATGSRPAGVPALSFDDDLVLSSTGALMLTSLPRRMLILGGGAVGVEFAYIFGSFGVEVHLAEALERLLPGEDADVSALVQREYKKKGIRIYTSTTASGMERGPSGVRVRLRTKGDREFEVEADKVLVAAGRRPNTDALNLEAAGVTRDAEGFIETGDFYKTATAGVYAIGDVVRSPMLAHVASREGEIAAESIAGKNPPPGIDPLLIPSAVYSEPQVGSFGLTEWRAKQDNVSYRAVSFPYRGTGKARAVERPEGFVKLLFDPGTREILGAHVAGDQATELIHELLLAKKAGLTTEDIAGMVHSHPTLSEAVMEAARAAGGRAIHV